MSTQKHIIEVTPPEYGQVWEKMEFHNYCCPVCNGRGYFSEQTGHDQYASTECDYCQGTGKVAAEVQINWKPDFI